ncbi:MAG: hypothetical protein IH611_11060 [Deltaproteobacteria bacterium]|nr:hypothetical protein [Deltaproteobacteria bacterium]
MTNRRFRFPVKIFAAVMSLACFLAFEIVAVSPVLAAEPAPKPPSTWETWPRGPATSGVPTGPATAGEAGGEKTSSGISAGTWGWIAGGVAAVALIAVAAGGGGGGSSSPPACNQ